MLSRRKIEVIAAVVILILLIGLLVFFLKQQHPKTPVSNEPPPTAEIVPAVNPADVPTPGVVSASTIARVFVERFGSYSSETNFANVDDIMALATPAYQAKLTTLVDGYRRQLDASSGYSGISTTIITLKTETQSDTAATFLVTTQRQEAVGSPSNTTTRYQDAEVSLVKAGDSWLIDDLTWK